MANHTFTHQPKNILHAKALANEIRHTDKALAHLDIVTPYFRPPYGITSPPVARAIRATAKKAIGWDIRSLDTVIHNEDKLFHRIVRKLTNGNIYPDARPSASYPHRFGTLIAVSQRK